MNNDLQDFELSMKRREGVARAYVSGDAEPLGHISATSSRSRSIAKASGYISTWKCGGDR
jgi:hypothetical protein